MVSWALPYLHTCTESCLVLKTCQIRKGVQPENIWLGALKQALKMLADMIRCLFNCLIYLIRTTLREMRKVMVMKMLLNADGSSIFYDHRWSVLTEVMIWSWCWWRCCWWLFHFLISLISQNPVARQGPEKSHWHVMGIGLFPACPQNNKSQAQNPVRQNITFRLKYSFRPFGIK